MHAKRDRLRPETMKETRTRSKHKRRRATGRGERSVNPVQQEGIVGGRYRPLTHDEQVLIDQAARRILRDTGMAEAPEIVIDQVTRAGGSVDGDGRLRYPDDLIAAVLDGLPRDFTLCGQDPVYDMRLGGARVHVGSGGAAPMILDLETERYRESTLRDLYDAARLVDSFDNIHFFSRSMVACDMPDALSLDINTAYACLAGTRKHVFAAASEAANVKDIAELCFAIAGTRELFLQRPFLSLNINMPVPPLRFDANSCEVAAVAARLGIPLHANTFGQMGASSPVTLAGSIAQTVAETLAGMIFTWLVNPEAKVIFGTRPMLTDLRTGAMSGGSAEGAVAMAASAQMAQYYNLPGSTIAGATDSKLADAQSGYEKCLAVTLAVQAGSNLVTQASGMQASLMGCALESYAIDNDMLGAILKSCCAIEVSDETLALQAIDDVARGEGHFLGRPETLERMQSDFVYPELADRRSIEEWEIDGSRDIRDGARAITRQILATHYPSHISPELDSRLRDRFDIRLPKAAMEAQ
jgi:trimethylamine--corrinoid protein Co-methyltransferase